MQKNLKQKKAVKRGLERKLKDIDNTLESLRRHAQKGSALATAKMRDFERARRRISDSLSFANAAIVRLEDSLDIRRRE